MELSQDVGHKPIVFIRFNPDEHTDENGESVTSCWGVNGKGICVVKKSKEKEWAEKLEAERLEREKAFLLLERERQYSELNEYRNTRVSQEQDNILPELLDLISGNNVEEIESSISGLKERSTRILDSTQAATQSLRREMAGTRTTLPPTLDTSADQQQFTAEQIANMSVAEYAKYRGKLLGNAAASSGKGIFG